VECNLSQDNERELTTRQLFGFPAGPRNSVRSVVAEKQQRNFETVLVSHDKDDSNAIDEP
jgi:hypothetical protein